MRHRAAGTVTPPFEAANLLTSYMLPRGTSNTRDCTTEAREASRDSELITSNTHHQANLFDRCLLAKMMIKIASAANSRTTSERRRHPVRSPTGSIQVKGCQNCSRRSLNVYWRVPIQRMSIEPPCSPLGSTDRRCSQRCNQPASPAHLTWEALDWNRKLRRGNHR